jgi:hypothetical protein
LGMLALKCKHPPRFRNLAIASLRAPGRACGRAAPSENTQYKS